MKPYDTTKDHKSFSRKPKEFGRFNTPAEAEAAGFDRNDFRGACFSETMGPNWKKLLWVNGRCYCLK